jgi:hypothetical protein
MAALPTSVDPVTLRPSLSLVPPPPAVAASPAHAEPRADRARFRRLVVFTGKIS